MNSATKKTKPAKSWLDDSSFSRKAPAVIVPRAVESTKKPPDSFLDDGSDDSDTEESAAKEDPLDAQVRRLLAGPGSDFGPIQQLSFSKGTGMKNARFAVKDEDAPPRMSLEEFDHQNFETNNLPKAQKAETNATLNSGLPSLILVDPGHYDQKKPSFFAAFYEPRDLGTTGLFGNQPEKAEPVEEYPVLVYGYKESDSVEVIRYFSKYGDILEDFEVLKGNNLYNFSEDQSHKTLPIQVGEGWVVLTYNTSLARMRALKEDGTVFKGYYIKVKMFSEELLKSLESGEERGVTYSSEPDKEDDALFPKKVKKRSVSDECAGDVSNVLPVHAPSRRRKIKSLLDGYVPSIAAHLNQDLLLFGKKEYEIKRVRVSKENTDHKLSIVNGKQLLLEKNKSRKNKKRSVYTPEHYEGQGVIGKALDWAFGFESL